MTPVNLQQTSTLPDHLRKRGLLRATIFTPSSVWKMVLLALVFMGLHYEHLRKLVRVWWTEPDWSHGFIIPLFSLYFLASNYQRLLKARIRPSYSGLVLVLIGLAMEATALFLRFDYGFYLGMIVLLFGMVLWLCGWQVIRVVWLPILFLIFAVNIPEMVYREVAYESQQFAAHSSVVALQILGVEAEMAGSSGQAETVIRLWDTAGKTHQLNVEEACSGMRLLMAFGALAVAVSYLSDRPAWQRIVLIVSAFPIAILCNLLRIVITGYLYYLGYSEYAQGLFHTFTGLLMLVPAGLMYFGLAKLMNLLVVEDYSVPESSAPDQPQAPTPTPADNVEQTPAASSGAGLWRSLFFDKHFMACLVLVFAAAVGLKASVGLLDIHFTKLPAALRQPLASLPKTLGSFQAYEVEDPDTGEIGTDISLPEEIIQALGTEVYLNRNYLDTEPQEGQSPLVSLFFTYYTGKPVLVPHAPERCQAAVGYTKTGTETFTVDVPGLGIPNDTVRVRASLFSGSDPRTGNTRSFAIIYFFVASGEYIDDWKAARLHLRSPRVYFFDKYSYYAFVRLTFPQASDKAHCISSAKKFLKVALPEIVRILPDWQALISGQ
ncbi:MAG: exosortase [Actinobacteria bacterium]|nr:exosortase [Actinomycetota bacterium]